MFPVYYENATQFCDKNKKIKLNSERGNIGGKKTLKEKLIEAMSDPQMPRTFVCD